MHSFLFFIELLLYCRDFGQGHNESQTGSAVDDMRQYFEGFISRSA